MSSVSHFWEQRGCMYVKTLTPPTNTMLLPYEAAVAHTRCKLYVRLGCELLYLWNLQAQTNWWRWATTRRAGFWGSSQSRPAALWPRAPKGPTPPSSSSLMVSASLKTALRTGSDCALSRLALKCPCCFWWQYTLRFVCSINQILCKKINSLKAVFSGLMFTEADKEAEED